jgi:mono/diheme cytochrome c family protein
MRRKIGFSAILLLGLAAIALMSILSVPALPEGTAEQVYKTKCATCHGVDGAGTTPAGKATKARGFCTDEVKKEIDEEWTAIIVKGKNKMPAYDKKLSEAEIKELVTYIRGLCSK